MNKGMNMVDIQFMDRMYKRALDEDTKKTVRNVGIGIGGAAAGAASLYGGYNAYDTLRDMWDFPINPKDTHMARAAKEMLRRSMDPDYIDKVTRTYFPAYHISGDRIPKDAWESTRRLVQSKLNGYANQAQQAYLHHPDTGYWWARARSLVKAHPKMLKFLKTIKLR